MERDAHKRKASQEYLDETSGSKSRKIHSQATLNNCISSHRSSITEKIISLWKTGSGSASKTTQEGNEIVRFQESPTKYMEVDKIIQSIKKKLTFSEENITELNILLKKETADKQSLLNKMSTTWELIANITQHINYITESLDRFQTHISDLSAKYNNIILKLQTKNVELETKLKQLMGVQQTTDEETYRRLEEKEAEFNEFRVNHELLRKQALQEKAEVLKIINEFENNKKKLLEMEIVENKLKEWITELDEIVALEKSKLEQINTIEERKCDGIRNTYELKMSGLQQNLENTAKRLEEVEKSQAEMLKILNEKDKLLEDQEQKVVLYQNQVRELMCQLTDIGLNLQHIQDEKKNLEKRLEIKNLELSEFQQKLEIVTAEKIVLIEEMTELKETLKKETKNCMELSANLTRSRIELQETVNYHNSMNKGLDQNKGSEYEIKNLQTEIKSLKQKLDQVLLEKSNEIQNRHELEKKYEDEIKIQREKYEKCLVDLDQLSTSMENASKQDSSLKSASSNITTDKEKLKKLFSIEKKKIEEKYIKSEKLLAEKTDVEKELKKKLSKLQIDLRSVETKYKDLESTKNNRIMALEKKLSNLGLINISQSIPTVQIRGNTAEPTKNIRVQKKEIIKAGNIKSILKPRMNSYSPKSSSKVSPKKISFNFGSDSSDDLNIQQRNSILPCNDKFEDLENTVSPPFTTQISVSQSTNPGTPKSNKFFKSRGNL